MPSCHPACLNRMRPRHRCNGGEHLHRHADGVVRPGLPGGGPRRQDLPAGRAPAGRQRAHCYAPRHEGARRARAGTEMGTRRGPSGRGALGAWGGPRRNKKLLLRPPRFPFRRFVIRQGWGPIAPACALVEGDRVARGATLGALWHPAPPIPASLVGISPPATPTCAPGPPTRLSLHWKLSCIECE